MNLLARRVFGALIAFVTGRAASDQAESGAPHLRGDALRGQSTSRPPPLRVTGLLGSYRGNQSPGGRSRKRRPAAAGSRIRPDRAQPELNEDQARRRDERRVRRSRQRRRAKEAEAAESANPTESRLSREAQKAQAALVREQTRRDAELRARERPYRTPLRNRTRIGPLRGVLKPRARLPDRDPRVDHLVTAGFIAAAVIIGGLTRLGDGPLLVIIGASFATVLVAVLVLDYRRWHGSFPARFTRAGAVAGLTFFVGITGIGRVGELSPIALPNGCSTEQVDAYVAEWYTAPEIERRAASVAGITGHLRRPGFLLGREERAEWHVSRGWQRVVLGEPEQALADYRRASELDPNTLWAPIQRANLFRVAGCPQYVHDQIASIQRLYMSSEDGVALRRAARLLLQFGYAEAALVVARRAAEWAPASPHEPEVTQGMALAQLGRLKEALDPLTASFERFFINEEASFFRALVHRRLGDRPSAWADIEHAIKRRPTWAAPHAAKGIMLVEEGRLGEGLESFAEAVRLDGPKPQAYFWRGQVLLDLGMAELARKDFRQTLRYQATSYVASSADPWVGLAAAELALGNREQAALALAESRSRSVRWVDEPTVLAWLEQLERELGSPPQN